MPEIGGLDKPWGSAICAGQEVCKQEGRDGFFRCLASAARMGETRTMPLEAAFSSQG